LNYNNYLTNHFVESLKIKSIFINNKSNIQNFSQSVDVIVKAYQKSSKTFWFGNGGSAGDAQHIVGELICKLNRIRPPLSAESLSVDTSVLTSIANDFGYDSIFSRQLEAKAKSTDIAIGISTSGNSSNIIKAFKYCKKNNIKTILLGGNNGGQAAQIADISLIIDSERTEYIQECHIMIGHCICYCVEQELFFNGFNDE